MARVLLVILIMVATLVNGGSGNIWATATTDKARVVDQRIGKMLDKLSRRSYLNDQERLHAIFRKTQKEFLHRYTQYSNIDDLAEGEFDCLTGTSLFAEILNRAGFQFRIMETTYHIFLLVNTSKGEVLIETTDRFGGFMTSPAAIAKRIEDYRLELPTERNSKTTYAYEFDLYSEISQEQLAGLLYFNQAVKAYNQGKWVLCSERVVLADSHSDSPRIDALASVLLCTVSVNEISAEEKHQVIANLKRLDAISAQAIASR